MPTVTVVGSVNLDLLVRVPRLPATGETVLGHEAVVTPGGKGANQAVAVRRLGGSVRLVAACGDDPFGDTLRATLVDSDVDTGGVVILPGVPSGLALIVVAPGGDNTITVAPGANALLRASHLPDLAHRLQAAVRGCEVLLLQLEIPVETALAAARVARAAGALVVLNAAPLPPEPAGELADLLAAVDVLVVNETEALALHRAAAAAERDGSAHRDWLRVAADLRDRGPGTVVITLGADGAVAVSPDGDGGAAVRRWVQLAFPVEAVDGTGAGDSFCGALAVRLAAGDPLDAALRTACAAGALATTRVGARAGIPTADQVERFLSDPAADHGADHGADPAADNGAGVGAGTRTGGPS